MTSEMAFECLFVSTDADLFSIVARILRQLSISIEVCLRSSSAFDILRKGSTDLVVIDWEGEDSSELLQTIWKDGHAKKPTIVAVLTTHCPVVGAHIIVNKPVSLESGERCFKAAYSRMLLDHRRHARHALMMPVVATDQDGREIMVTVIDIGDGGVGLSTREKLVIGDVLSFRLLLPGTPREVLVHTRVLWTREYCRVGCEFVRIPPTDLMILHDWLKSKSQVKKPLLAV
jgi:PilZ domain